MFIRRGAARAAWTATVNIGSRRGVWGTRVSPRPRPREGLGGRSPRRRTLFSPCGCGPEARAPGPRPTGGSGRAQPSQEQPYVHCGVVRRSRMDGYREHRLSKRVWGNRVFPRPRPAGAWGHRVSPCPHPREGLGGRSPPRNNRMCIAALCGGAAWTAEVNTVRRVLPPSQPPPAGGRSRVPAPSGGGGGSRHRARGAAPRAGRPRSRAGCIGRGAPCA